MNTCSNVSCQKKNILIRFDEEVCQCRGGEMWKKYHEVEKSKNAPKLEIA